MSLNRVTLYGNLVRESELVMTTNGMKILHNSIAVSEVYKKEKKTDFFEITAFGDKADVIEKFFKKGQPILIEGKLKQEKWEKDGKKGSRVVIWVDNVVFTESKKSNSSVKLDSELVSSIKAENSQTGLPTPAQNESPLSPSNSEDDTPF